MSSIKSFGEPSQYKQSTPPLFCHEGVQSHDQAMPASSSSRARRLSNQPPVQEIQIDPSGFEMTSRTRRLSSGSENKSAFSVSDLPVPAALQERSQQLEPVDGGRTALLFLFAALIAELTTWGLPFSVGVLHVEWTHSLFRDQGGESLLTLAATLQVRDRSAPSLLVSI